jgi:4-hydroxybenzoate polyprenyltransferase
LLKTDSLWESIFALFSSKPFGILRLLPFLLRNDRAGLKAACAGYALPGIAFWPFNAEVLQENQSARQTGREVWLATAAHETIAEAVAARLDCFDGIFATRNGINLKGASKAERLRERFGEQGFDYIGDSPDDLPVWAVCREAVVVNPSEALRRKIAAINPRFRVLSTPQASTPAVYLRAVRVKQWLKNILVAVPLFLTQMFTFDAFATIVVAFLSFSLCASAFYLINDLLDITSDRRHATKKDRPFAAGALPPARGLALSGLFFVASLGLALPLGTDFTAVIASYALLTLLYSKAFKARLILDVVCLGILYTLRVVAGVAALHVPMSSWLLGFSFFFFLGLAFIKRLTEIRRSDAFERLPGRAYKSSDGMIVECMAAAGGFAAVVILSLYIESVNAARFYAHPQFLWATVPLVLYWFCRLLVLTHRDEMHDDPVLFVVRDKASVVCGLAALFVLFCAV